jgi:cytidylate kinase
LTTNPPDTNPPSLIIAIDGPAGAGKSAVASRLAQRLGIPYLDTGAMYRAVALLAIRDGLETPLEEEASRRVVELMDRHRIEVEAGVGGTAVFVDGHDVGAEIRTPECSLMASAVSALLEVRQALVPLQRELGLQKGGVMEGRDIGTVVFPDADLKVFLTASVEERARRRHDDLRECEVDTSLEEVRDQQQQRDLQDTSRAESPLQVAHGSLVVDTTELSLDEVVERLIREVAKILAE